MFRELTQTAVVDSFKQELKNMRFVAEHDYPSIEQRIQVLTSQETRDAKIESSKWLWEFFTEKALSSITDNLRGYRDLQRYFQEYVEYENLLFSFDDSHRDHVIHLVWVMLIGFYLRRHYSPFTKFEHAGTVGMIGEAKEVEEKVKQTITAIRKHERSLWCLIALNHDLGYPIEKTRMANKNMAKMIRNFGFLEQRDFSYNFTVLHQPAIDELLNNIVCQLVWTAPGGYHLVYPSGSRLDFAKSLERLDHGIMSAYLFQMYMDCVCDLLGMDRGLPSDVVDTDIETAAKQATLIELLEAMSTHTNSNRYFHSYSGMSQLLLLSDELDEFSRYSHAVGGYEWKDFKCRVELECTQHSLGMKYTFDNAEIADDMEPFFKGKVATMYNRFDVRDNNIKNITITCRDVRKDDEINLVFEKSLPALKTGIVKRIPGKESFSVTEYLSGDIQLLSLGIE